jgi:hypothetical protein
MAIEDLYLVNRDSDLHLRDARHAHQLYNQHNFALAPKQKFLYHVVFDFNASNGFIPNSLQFQKELGVLCNSINLPSFKIDVDTKRQYNRKKNFQTGIEYDEVTMNFVDDNTGITRALLEEYYRFYYRDGGKHQDGNAFDFDPRDKLSKKVPRYGMDNLEGKGGTFFKRIRIYQLSRQKWVSYTLVNPLITSFSHDDMSYADSGSVMENKVSVAYEAVMYDSGHINPFSEPAGFTSQETRYDVVDSPLGNNLTYGANVAQAGAGRGIEPSIIKQNTGNNSGIFGILGNVLGLASNSASNSAGDPAGLLNKIKNASRLNNVGGLRQIELPRTSSVTTTTLSTLPGRGVQNLDADVIRSTLSSNKLALNSTVKRSLATGAYSSSWNSNNFGNFDKLEPLAKVTIENEVIDRAAGNDRKLRQIASQVISTIKGKL